MSTIANNRSQDESNVNGGDGADKSLERHSSGAAAKPTNGKNDAINEEGAEEESPIISMTIRVGYSRGKMAFKEDGLVEVVFKAPDDVVPLKREQPVFENVGFGVFPEEAEHQWPSRKKRRVQASTASAAVGSLPASKVARRTRGGRAQSGIDLSSEEDADQTLDSLKQRRNPQRGLNDGISGRQKSKSLFITSRVGSRFQVDAFPTPGSAVYDEEGEMGEVMWDPVAANRAREEGKAFDTLLEEQEQVPLPVKMLFMQGLHEVGYDPVLAKHRFVQLVQRLRSKSNVDPCVELSTDDAFTLEQIFQNQQKKDFKAISKRTGLGMDAILVHYYSWKRANPKDYKRAKTMRKASSSNDYCEVCDDGGTLIICEVCRKAFHMECLNPPLTEVPEESWFCDTCITRSPARIVRSPASVRSIRRLSPSTRDQSGGNQAKRSLGKSDSPSVPESATVSPHRNHAKGSPGKLNSPASVESNKTSFGRHYVAEIPLGPQSQMYIKVGTSSSGKGIVFLGYLKQADGTTMGYAEANSVFDDVGDRIVAVNGRSIRGMSWDVAEPVFAEAKRTSRSVRLLMARRSMSPTSETRQPGLEQRNAPGLTTESNQSNGNKPNGSQTASAGATTTHVGLPVGLPVAHSSNRPSLNGVLSIRQTTGSPPPAAVPGMGGATLANGVDVGNGGTGIHSVNERKEQSNVPTPIVSAATGQEGLLAGFISDQSNVSTAQINRSVRLPGEDNAPLVPGTSGAVIFSNAAGASNSGTGILHRPFVGVSQHPNSMAPAMMQVQHPFPSPALYPWLQYPPKYSPVYMALAGGLAQYSQYMNPQQNMGYTLGSSNMQMYPMRQLPHAGQVNAGHNISNHAGQSRTTIVDVASTMHASPKHQTRTTVIDLTKETEQTANNDQITSTRTPDLANATTLDVAASKEPHGRGHSLTKPLYSQYIARVPITNEGLCLVITEKDGVPCFNGYRRLSNGEKSPAMLMNPPPFRCKGDEILAIDNIPIQDMDYDSVIKLLMTHGNKEVRILRMRTPIKT